MSRQYAPVADDDVLVGDDAVHEYIFADDRVLEQNRVLDSRAATDLDAAENERVLDIAVDYAAVGDERVFDI